MNEIPNFLEFQYSKQGATAVAQDSAPKHKGDVRYLIDCRDIDHNLLELIKYIGKIGNTGHSFSITVDPGSDTEKKFGWDGDGSDSIRSVTKLEKDDDIVGLLMANINTMRWIARPAIPDPDDPGKKLDDPIEALKKIEYACDTLLDGDIRENIKTTESLCKLIIEKCDDYKGGPTPDNPNWTNEDSFNHIKEICEDHIKRIREVTKEDKKAVAKDEDINYGKALSKIEEEFIAEARKIGKKHSCFYEAIRDDNALYIQLQPAMDFTKGYEHEPSNKERAEDFEKFRKELDELAERLGCKRMEYTCNPDSKSMSLKEKDGRDYMNFLSTSVKEETWKKAAESSK